MSSRAVIAPHLRGARGPGPGFNPPLFSALIALSLLAPAACADDDDGEPNGSAAGSGGAVAGEDGGAKPAPGNDGGLPPPVCDVVPPTRCVDEPTYAEVEAIVKKRCIGCHDGRGEEWPLTSQPHVSMWFNEIRGMMITCAMPPPASGMTMPTAERELILEWIRCKF
jgi:hypothetical protein